MRREKNNFFYYKLILTFFSFLEAKALLYKSLNAILFLDFKSSKTISKIVLS